MNPETKTYRIRTYDKVSMFFIGAINNLPYVIAIASAKRIVKHFQRPNDLGLVLWANTISGVFSRFLNTWLTSINMSYYIRFGFNCLAMLFGLVGCAFAQSFGFALTCILFIGFSSFFGEAVILCYITYRRKQPLLRSWSSGTGMAGIIGATYSLMVEKINAQYKMSFLIVSPIVFLYIGLFLVIVFSPEEDREENLNPEPLLEEINLVEQHVSIWSWTILKPVWWYIFNCCSVYFLEYVIQGAFADCSQTPSMSQEYPYMFPLLNLMYQIGVFISRSSLTFFKFPHVGTVSACQLFMFLIWLSQPFYYWMTFYVQLSLMSVVGLFGGLSYVNVFDLIMNVRTLSTKEKEMATSWNALSISLGIVTASLFTYIAEQTFLYGKSRPK